MMDDEEWTACLDKFYPPPPPVPKGGPKSKRKGKEDKKQTDASKKKAKALEDELNELIKESSDEGERDESTDSEQQELDDVVRDVLQLHGTSEETYYKDPKCTDGGTDVADVDQPPAKKAKPSTEEPGSSDDSQHPVAVGSTTGMAPGTPPGGWSSEDESDHPKASSAASSSKPCAVPVYAVDKFAADEYFPPVGIKFGSKEEFVLTQLHEGNTYHVFRHDTDIGTLAISRPLKGDRNQTTRWVATCNHGGRKHHSSFSTSIYPGELAFREARAFLISGVGLTKAEHKSKLDLLLKSGTKTHTTGLLP